MIPESVGFLNVFWLNVWNKVYNWTQAQYICMLYSTTQYTLVVKPLLFANKFLNGTIVVVGDIKHYQAEKMNSSTY